MSTCTLPEDCVKELFEKNGRGLAVLEEFAGRVALVDAEKEVCLASFSGAWLMF